MQAALVYGNILWGKLEAEVEVDEGIVDELRGAVTPVDVAVASLVAFELDNIVAAERDIGEAFLRFGLLADVFGVDEAFAE